MPEFNFEKSTEKSKLPLVIFCSKIFAPFRSNASILFGLKSNLESSLKLQMSFIGLGNVLKFEESSFELTPRVAVPKILNAIAFADVPSTSAAHEATVRCLAF